MRRGCNCGCRRACYNGTSNCSNDVNAAVINNEAVIEEVSTSGTEEISACGYTYTQYEPTATAGCENVAGSCYGIASCVDSLGNAITREREICCDPNGYCASYPVDCRNTFWPAFSKPSWLACEDLYCNSTNNTYC